MSLKTALSVCCQEGYDIWMRYLLFYLLLSCLSPCVWMYCLITSAVAPPVLIRQKLCDQNISFHNYLRISWYSFLISLLLADLYAFMNLDISVFGWPLKRICTWSLSWFHSSRVILYEGAIYINISLSLSDILSSITLRLYLVHMIRWYWSRNTEWLFVSKFLMFSILILYYDWRVITRQQWQFITSLTSLRSGGFLVEVCKNIVKTDNCVCRKCFFDNSGFSDLSCTGE